MASIKIFALIFIIKFVTSSLAVRVVPLGEISNGHGLIIGRRAPLGYDEVLLVERISIPARHLRRVRHEETFHTPNHEIITQVRVDDPTMEVTGVQVTLIDKGPGYENVTLSFLSRWNSGIEKVVVLFGHRYHIH